MQFGWTIMAPRWSYYSEKQRHGILYAALVWDNSALPLSLPCLRAKESLGTWLKRGTLGKCHQPVLRVGVEDQLMAMLPVLDIYYELGMPPWTLLLCHLIYKVNPILPCRRSQAGGSRGNRGVIAVVLLQTTMHRPRLPSRSQQNPG